MEVIDLNRLPDEAILKANEDGSRFIPINFLEDELDKLGWSTRNFHHSIFKDGYANLVIAASLELVITHDGNERSFVGAASFSLKSLEPNTHFLATAKSECIKNAASDIGVFYGRHLNDDVLKNIELNKVKPEKPKSKPDSKIMKQFLEAIEKGDTATQTMLSNIYEIKIPDA
jgi:hypothetical protein